MINFRRSHDYKHRLTGTKPLGILVLSPTMQTDVRGSEFGSTSLEGRIEMSAIFLKKYK